MRKYTYTALIVSLVFLVIGFLPTRAQSTKSCVLIETGTFNTDLSYSLFGAGRVEETTITGKEMVALTFLLTNDSRACSGNQSAILVMDYENAPYHIRINNAWVSFTGQIAFGISTTNNVITISVLKGSAAVFKGPDDVILIPMGYSMYASIGAKTNEVVGYWGGQSPMQFSDRSNLQDIEIQNPTLGIETPDDETIKQSEEEYSSTTSNSSETSVSIPVTEGTGIQTPNCVPPNCTSSPVNPGLDGQGSTSPVPCNGCQIFTPPNQVLDPAQPIIPVQPVVPIIPVQPVVPIIPVQPVVPIIPIQPVIPDQQQFGLLP